MLVLVYVTVCILEREGDKVMIERATQAPGHASLDHEYAGDEEEQEVESVYVFRYPRGSKGHQMQIPNRKPRLRFKPRPFCCKATVPDNYLSFYVQHSICCLYLLYPAWHWADPLQGNTEIFNHTPTNSLLRTN